MKVCRLFRSGLTRTLFICFLCLSVLPVCLVGIATGIRAHSQLHTDTGVRLYMAATCKIRQIKSYYNEMLRDVRYQTNAGSTWRFMQWLVNRWDESDQTTDAYGVSPSRSADPRDASADLAAFRSTCGFHDVLLVDRAGNVRYSVKNEGDLGKNLFTGSLSASRLSAACARAMETDQPVFSDYGVYPPSGGVFGFVVQAIRGKGALSPGLLVVQFSLAPIDAILRQDMGLGETSETYLVGADGWMRSNVSSADVETAMTFQVDTDQIRAFRSHLAENRKKDIETAGYTASTYNGLHGHPVLGVQAGFVMGTVPMALIAEVEIAEAFGDTNQYLRYFFFLLTLMVTAVAMVGMLLSAKIVRPIREVADGARLVANGDLDHVIDVQASNEVGRLAASINRMLTSIRKYRMESEQRNWMITGHTQLYDEMRGEPDLQTLTSQIITLLCDHLEAPVGAFYVLTGRRTLKLAGTYAWKNPDDKPRQFAVGEGLVGQVARDRNMVLVSDCPTDYMQVASGLGSAAPNYLMVFPLCMDDKLTGVVEIGGFKPFNQTQIRFLHQVSESIVVAVDSCMSRVRMQTLLTKTREQAEALKSREEDLNQANRELEEQAVALRASEARLKDQQEVLRHTNEELEWNASELEEQTTILESQKSQIQKKNLELESARQTIEEKAAELELSSRYKSEFLANMSHELRTPLNSMLLLARHLVDNPDQRLSSDQQESAEAILTAGEDLLSLINDILDLSKVEAGKLDVYPAEMPISEFLAGMQRTFTPLAIQKGLIFAVRTDEDLPELMVTDKQRLEQIIKNFISNALKFTSQGVITLSVQIPDTENLPAEMNLTPENAVSISVSDTGIGIPEDKQRLIFEAFQQADGSTSRLYGGTGLGLSIARELSLLIGGRIFLTSRVGEGSVFTLILPRRMAIKKGVPEDLGPDAVLAMAPGPGDHEAVPHANAIDLVKDDRRNLLPKDRRVLIIEDDPVFARALRDMAHENGFKALVAGDGETGLQFADYYAPSAILLELGLPRLNGWGVMARLKERPDTRHIPVHLFSGTDAELDALKMGAAGFHLKPVNAENLFTMYTHIHQMISKPVKDLLVVEDNTVQQQAIAKIIGNGDVKITFVRTAEAAEKALAEVQFDCLVLDIGLPDKSGLGLLDQVQANSGGRHLPVIVYTGRELTAEERSYVDSCAASTVLKGVESHQKLLDETTLFLHRNEVNLPEAKQAILRRMYDKDAILANKEVLIVDDDMRNIFSLKQILENRGMTTRVARNGREALERLDAHPDVHLVLMDIMMPVMDGYAAIRAIRAQEKFRDLPVIALTAKAMKGDRAKCIEAGASDYLEKPVDPDRLFSMLRVWLYQATAL
ncbi:MAG: hypothetical protein CSA22_04370 [Deltaproteobacteria bacterium]|nr:MAG: hypothetical protein CSA22_04370 [Deltaproteobacteria bacterium]